MNNSMDIKYIWEETLNRVSVKVPQVVYDVWIKTLLPAAITDDKLILLAPLEACRTIVNQHYKTLISSIVNEICPFISVVDIICEDDNPEILSKSEVITSLDPVIEPIREEELSFFDEFYTFDNFVIGGSNQIAVAAAKAVAENPGVQHNPLFIYGGVGLGKTHIMHAIGNYIRKHSPKKKILYVTTAQFTNEFIESIAKAKNNDLPKQFRDKYRNVDVLMLDDIQFISGKLSTQEALFHTFNDLYQSRRQIIFTSDCHPNKLNNLEDRLKSRFQCGLTVDITPPDLETRIAILQRKAFQKKYQVSQDVINYIAEKVDSNIRELEASLSKVMFYCSLGGLVANSIDIVNAALKDEIDVKSGPVTIDFIVNKVSEYFNIDKSDLIGKKKTKIIAEPRQVAIYMISELLSMPLTAIGDYFGGRDHSTIIHARDKIASLIKTNPCYASYVKDLTDIIKNR